MAILRLIGQKKKLEKTLNFRTIFLLGKRRVFFTMPQEKTLAIFCVKPLGSTKYFRNAAQLALKSTCYFGI